MSRIAEIYRRIAQADRPEVFTFLRPQAEVEAEFLAASGPLQGLVVAVKDNIDVAGLPTTAACPGFAYTPGADAAAVAALRAAGAVVLGKTNLDQFATGLVGTRSPYGAVRDSRRPEFISGGSSSGSAVAVALGLCDVALGTDTAGSGRVPAGLQGIVGLKPTVGVVPVAGVVPACASYDCVSVFAADVGLAGRVAAVLAKGGRAWPSDIPLAAPPGAVVAVPAQLPGLDAVWQEAFAAAVERLRATGAAVVEVDFAPFLAAAELLYGGALVAERWHAVGASLGVEGVDPVVAGIIRGGEGFSAAQLLQDQARVRELKGQALGLLAGCDALLVPTAPTHPTIAQVQADPVGVNTLMGTYTNFANLFGMCAVAVPAGVTGDGAQFGVTLLAPEFHDAVVADLAGRFVGGVGAGGAGEGLSWPELAGAPAVELAVFGAHLRGQPLEHQLTALGARWAGPVATAPAYRLVELDTVPPKPGLVRDPAAGAAIAGEVWALSPAALGEFLAALPAPMALGAVELSDGRWVTGFGCAHDVVAGARDITAYGGWVAARQAGVR